MKPNGRNLKMRGRLRPAYGYMYEKGDFLVRVSPSKINVICQACGLEHKYSFTSAGVANKDEWMALHSEYHDLQRQFPAFRTHRNNSQSTELTIMRDGSLGVIARSVLKEQGDGLT